MLTGSEPRRHRGGTWSAGRCPTAPTEPALRFLFSLMRQWVGKDSHPAALPKVLAGGPQVMTGLGAGGSPEEECCFGESTLTLGARCLNRAPWPPALTVPTKLSLPSAREKAS